MKRCPLCGQGYTDNTLNFCLNDGELLMQYRPQEQSPFQDETPTKFLDDSPPTVRMDPGRITNQTNWPQSQPPAPWQSQTPSLTNPQYGLAGYAMSRDQTLPTIALVLGISSLLMVCCYGGVWLGVPAAIIGYLGMKNADREPTRYTGRGMAVAGMVIGVVTFLISLIFLIITGLA